MSRLRVLIADDQPRARAALRALLATSDRIEVVGAADSGASALEMVAAHRPDVLVVDVEMPPRDGLAVLRQVRTSGPGTRLVAVSMFAGHRHAALAAGADAFVAKTDPPEHFLAAVLATPGPAAH